VFERKSVVQNLRVAVDVGGTFTDICIMDEATASYASRRRLRPAIPSMIMAAFPGRD